jgi:hypothetical protein
MLIAERRTAPPASRCFRNLPPPVRPAPGMALRREPAGIRRHHGPCADAPTPSAARPLTECADTPPTAFGRGKDSPSFASVSVQALCSMAFIGDPWPTNGTGIFGKLSSLSRSPKLQFDNAPQERLFDYSAERKNSDLVVTGALIPDRLCPGCSRSGSAAPDMVR